MPLRSQSKHFCLGVPNNLPSNQLPTNQDVVNYIRLLLNDRAKKHSETFRSVAEKVLSMWANEGNLLNKISDLSVTNWRFMRGRGDSRKAF